MASLGTKLIHLRQQYRYSQTAIAEIFDVSQNAYNKWEADKCKPSADNMVKLSKYYKIDIFELLDDNKEISFTNNEIRGANSKVFNNVFATSKSYSSFIEQMHQMQEQISNLLGLQNHLMEELLENR